MIIGQFTQKARKTTVDNNETLSVWSDGVSLNSDQGDSKFMGGMSSPSLFQLEEGTEYRVTVEKIQSETTLPNGKAISGSIQARYLTGGMEILDPVNGTGQLIEIRNAVLVADSDDDLDDKVLLSTSLGIAEVDAESIMTLVSNIPNYSQRKSA